MNKTQNIGRSPPNYILFNLHKTQEIKMTFKYVSTLVSVNNISIIILMIGSIPMRHNSVKLIKIKEMK